MTPRTTEGTIDVATIVAILRQHWRRIGVLAAAAAVMAAAASFLMPNSYTSVTSFTPESRQSTRLAPSLLGLASQFGVNLGDEGNDSPAFYADLARSREVSIRILFARVPNYRTDAPGDSLTLIDLLRIRGRQQPLRVERGLERLGKMVAVSTTPKTGVVSIRVTSRWPHLSRDLTGEYLRTINHFNTSRRSSQAANRRRFVEERSAEAERDLRVAEDALRRFQMQNRSVRNSPALLAEQTVLERQIAINEDLYLAVRRQLETARIDEMNDTPVITVIDRPSLPGRHSSPKRVLIALFAGVMGLMGGSVVVVYRTLARASRFVPIPPTSYTPYDVARV